MQVLRKVVHARPCLSIDLQGELFVTVEAEAGECAFRTRGKRANGGKEEKSSRLSEP